MSASWPSVTCWYRSAARAEAWPMRAMSAFRLAPLAAARVAAVCLVSWKRKPVIPGRGQGWGRGWKARLTGSKRGSRLRVGLGHLFAGGAREEIKMADESELEL